MTTDDVEFGEVKAMGSILNPDKENNQTGFIYGRRQSVSYLVQDIDGNIISSGVSYKKLSLIEKRKGWIVDFK